MSRENFLPEDIRHWDHLIGRYDGSATLDEYVARVLAAEQQSQIAHDDDALRRLSLAFAAPALIPKDLLNDLDPSKRHAALRSIAELPDPFARVAALHFCADRLEPETEAIGLEALEGLFADMDRLQTYLRVFGATFVMASAALARHEVTGRAPAFWRRLAAHAHAALVVRASGNVKGDQQNLMAWATGHSGAAYLTATLRDFPVEPRWRPDWIDSGYLIADLYGRANIIVSGLGDKAPARWSELVAKAKDWIDERYPLSSAHYPAVMEGARRPLPKLDEMGELAELFRSLATVPTFEAFVRLTPLVHAFMPPIELEMPAIELTRRLLRPLSEDDAQYARVTLALAGHVAVLLQSAPLAAAIADVTLGLVQRQSEIVGVGDAVCRLLEANAALSDRSEADRVLSRQLEMLAFSLVAQSDLGNLGVFLTALQADPLLSPLLGRAAAIADLGARRAGAAA